MLLSSPEELRAFLPNHKFRNLDTMAGFLTNSEESFLRERIGKPLLHALKEYYAAHAPIVSVHDPDDLWASLVTLCQRVIVYDAFERAAALRAVSENDMGLNVADSDNYDAAEDKRIEAYRRQLNKERHEAVNMLLVRLEEWQQDGEATDIIDLWRQSSTYYFSDGLLLPTATEFNKYIDFYENREKFIQLLPDIRYCQETYIESEIGDRLLAFLIEAHRTGTLTPVGQRAYIKLQRTLSLHVEARSKLFTRPQAGDEASGHMRLTLSYLRSNQSLGLAPVNEVATSPVFDPHLWSPTVLTDELTPEVILTLPCKVRREIERHTARTIQPDGTFSPSSASASGSPSMSGSSPVSGSSPAGSSCHHDPHDPYPYMIHPPHRDHHHHAYDPHDHAPHDHDRDGGSFLTTSLI